MRAKDYRRIARENLKGSWRKSAIILLIVLLMTGLIGTIYTYTNLGSTIYDRITSDDVNDLKEPAETTPTETTPEDAENDIMGQLLNTSQDDPMPIQIISYVCFVFAGFFALGHCRFLLNQYHGRNATFSDLLEQKWLFSSAFLVKLIRFAFTVLFNFFATFGIVPNIYFHYRHCMAMYILLDNPHMRPEIAVRESAKLMKGHKWEMFCLDMSFVGWHILGIFTLGIGNLFVGAYASAAHAAFYRNLCPEEKEEADEILEEEPAV